MKSNIDVSPKMILGPDSRQSGRKFGDGCLNRLNLTANLVIQATVPEFPFPKFSFPSLTPDYATEIMLAEILEFRSVDFGYDVPTSRS